MAIRHSQGRIWITDPADQEIVFDTDERLLICPEFVSGSVQIPSRSCLWSRNAFGQETRTNVDIDQTFTLQSVNPHVDVVVGAFRVVSAGGPEGISDFGWFSAGGTYVHTQLAKTVISTIGIRIYTAVGGLSGYTFGAGGGLLRLHERVVFECARPDSNNVTHEMSQSPLTFEYRLFVGSFV